jgi:Spy/CpxP family protein refolding chaperone
MQGFQRGSPLGGRRISEFLKLTPEQDARFREIMAESFRELGKLRTKQEPIFRQLDQLRQEQEPQLEAIRTETNRKLMTILNEEQKKKFSEFLKETENWRGHPPHGGRGMEPSPPPQGFRDGRQ